MYFKAKLSKQCKKICKFYDESSWFIDYIELSQNLFRIIL
jgi:hypothetical protein